MFIKQLCKTKEEYAALSDFNKASGNLVVEPE